ncbi:hypothetical protein ERO13_D01G090550v2 [Gossypium hirsutum]|uniref:Uncharacterized protein n=1 Tax=Gossypium barbadense TaxID=3634 RepID=A0A5J5SPC9_GOSBA|nr:hypothetical protein ES319_D01G110300v1 [Gossypium barbadense]KAG4161995.1 hypothetical protein ERO13_D01G090550v2 [Gossypium hirsutum]
MNVEPSLFSFRHFHSSLLNVSPSLPTIDLLSAISPFPISPLPPIKILKPVPSPLFFPIRKSTFTSTNLPPPIHLRSSTAPLNSGIRG